MKHHAGIEEKKKKYIDSHKGREYLIHGGFGTTKTQRNLGIPLQTQQA